jgi:archaeosine synthase
MPIVSSLRFYNPKEVYDALTNNNEVKRWLKFVSTCYEPPKAKIYLIYPCSAEKPYHESRSYKILFRTLSQLGEKRRLVHVFTISEPFGIVPEEFYGKKSKWHDWKNRWYDCPGLFKWWCRKNNQPYSKEYVEKSIDILSYYVAKFFEKVKKKENSIKVVAFIRSYSSSFKVSEDHTHRRIIEKAARVSGLNVKILPTKKMIYNIIVNHGRYAWDMYGVAHPMAQSYLLKYLRGILNEL